MADAEAGGAGLDGLVTAFGPAVDGGVVFGGGFSGRFRLAVDQGALQVGRARAQPPRAAAEADAVAGGAEGAGGVQGGVRAERGAEALVAALVMVEGRADAMRGRPVSPR